MRMKIPVVEQSANLFSSQESSAGYLSSDNSEAGQQEEGESNPLYSGGETPTASDDFSEYLWMENEEEFDKQILQQLEEEALMEHCLEVMMDHEHHLDTMRFLSSLSSDDTHSPSWSGDQQAQNGSELCRQMSNLRVQDKDELAKQSTLNPNAAEFVPQSRTSSIPLVEKSS
ncbi:polyadenylate-binding protein-interacting protein 2 [Macrosteles quadrilineatus]|uniref:polyadenylate-binding protein-interacting protein 2 n=1 Tax=Macrosteles quadrilineatus TaxID=74068 RepID=UPI0023E0F227|nr:polyadenylate-binding protein-interacting protein 2 [Macrosteles quadrilineatus]XP_054261149.1 polyadenylate-binding protein-interacting protein 2 [Macrosteles quadrilineatus]XP_054261150.1 polyadenylate-binding protein-interacting protein 2 [Macrosteles quadrilineatus]